MKFLEAFRHGLHVGTTGDPSRARAMREQVERVVVTEGGYPCSVDGEPCPCGFDSDDCR